jgi:hypothetical protein
MIMSVSFDPVPRLDAKFNALFYVGRVVRMKGEDSKVFVMDSAFVEELREEFYSHFWCCDVRDSDAILKRLADAFVEVEGDLAEDLYL